MKRSFMFSFNEFLTEGGKSGGARYNTELASLLSFCGDMKGFDPNMPENNFNPKMLQNPEYVYGEIKKFLPPSYDEKKFTQFYNFSKKVKPLIEKRVGKINQLFWVGGSNLSGDEANPADVEFVGSSSYGISIKDKSGITLSNLSPKRLGLDSEVGEDTIRYYSTVVRNTKSDVNLFEQLKKKVFITLIIEATKTKKRIAPIKDYYFIEAVDNNKFLIGYKKGSKKVEEVFNRIELLSPDNYAYNRAFHRVFGDYMVANKKKFSPMIKRLYKFIGETIVGIIQDKLNSNNELLRVLNVGIKSYFYQTPSKLYYVPSVDELKNKNLIVKDIQMGTGDISSGVKFNVVIGDSNSKDNSTLELYIRYANGVFATNSTVRVQTLKNPENIFWEKII